MLVDDTTKTNAKHLLSPNGPLESFAVVASDTVKSGLWLRAEIQTETLPFSAAFVVESLLAGLHSEVAARSTDILESDTEALYAPLEALARETSPYVSKAARCILELLNPNPAA